MSWCACQPTKSARYVCVLRAESHAEPRRSTTVARGVFVLKALRMLCYVETQLCVSTLLAHLKEVRPDVCWSGDQQRQRLVRGALLLCPAARETQNLASLRTCEIYCVLGRLDSRLVCFQRINSIYYLLWTMYLR
jgi:hypothetical protein